MLLYHSKEFLQALARLGASIVAARLYHSKEFLQALALLRHTVLLYLLYHSKEFLQALARRFSLRRALSIVP